MMNSWSFKIANRLLRICDTRIPNTSGFSKMLEYTDAASLPEPLSARHRDTFAYPTMKERQPTILTQLIDYLYRDRTKLAQKYGEDVLEDLKAITERLAQLRYELMTDKPLRLLEDAGMPDLELWNRIIDESKWEHAKKQEDSKWFTAPWMLTETYLYRRMKEAFNLGSETGKLKDFDYFAHKKEPGFTESLPSVKILAKFLVDKLGDLKPEKAAEAKTLCIHLLELCLWGNKNDMCISAGRTSVQKTDPLEDLDTYRPHLLSDHLDDVWSFFLSSLNLGPAEIGFVCDNAAFEFFSDMALADFLVSSGIASRVVFHLKIMPWFVSDTLPGDVEFMLKTMESDVELAPLAARWRGFFTSSKWAVETDLYWTLGASFANMKQLRPELYRRLSQSRLLFIKGDLNYRRLVSDLNWEHTTSFDLALLGFHPCALVALRTIKADVVAGLRPGVGKNAHTLDPDWMTTGKYGLVQFSGRKDTAIP